MLLGYTDMREYHVMLPRRQGVVIGSPEFEIVARQFGLGVEQRAGQKYDKNGVESDRNSQAVFSENFGADEARPMVSSTKLHRRFSSGDGEVKQGVGGRGVGKMSFCKDNLQLSDELDKVSGRTTMQRSRKLTRRASTNSITSPLIAKSVPNDYFIEKRNNAGSIVLDSVKSQETDRRKLVAGQATLSVKDCLKNSRSVPLNRASSFPSRGRALGIGGERKITPRRTSLPSLSTTLRPPCSQAIQCHDQKLSSVDEDHRGTHNEQTTTTIAKDLVKLKSNQSGSAYSRRNRRVSLPSFSTIPKSGKFDKFFQRENSLNDTKWLTVEEGSEDVVEDCSEKLPKDLGKDVSPEHIFRLWNVRLPKQLMKDIRNELR